MARRSIFTKRSNLDVWQGSEHASDICQQVSEINSFKRKLLTRTWKIYQVFTSLSTEKSSRSQIQIFCRYQFIQLHLYIHLQPFMKFIIWNNIKLNHFLRHFLRYFKNSCPRILTGCRNIRVAVCLQKINIC